MNLHHMAQRARTLRSRLVGSGERRSIASNTGWLLFDRLVRALLGILVGAWVARYLGPAEYGQLAYVTAFVAIFMAIASLSADAIVVRDIAQDPGATEQILGSVFAIRLAVGVLAWGAVVSCVFIANPGDSRLVAMTAIAGATLVFQAAETVDLWFQSQSQSRRTVAAKLSVYVISSGVKVLLILSEAPLMAFACVAALEALACALALGVALRWLPTQARWSFVAARAQQLMREAAPFIVSGLSIMLYSRIDQILIKQLIDEHALGIYSAALPLSQFWQVIPMALATSFAPFIATRKLRGEAEYQRAIVLIFRLFFYLGVGSALFMWFASDIVVQLLFGHAYRESAETLRVHALSNVFCFLGIAHGLWLVNERRFAVRLYGTLVAGVATIALNVMLLPRIGVIGAAYAAIAAQIIAAFLVNIVLDQKGFRLQCRAIAFGKV